MALDVSTATMPELKAEFVRLAEVVTPLLNERAAIQAEIERRVKDIRARERVRALTAEDRQALKAALEAT